MSRTIKQQQSPGKDWWGKRPLSGMSATHSHQHWWWKRRLHKIERRRLNSPPTGDGGS